MNKGTKAKKNATPIEKDYEIFFIDGHLPYTLEGTQDIFSSGSYCYGADEYDASDMIELFINNVIGKLITINSNKEAVTVKVDKYPMGILQDVLSKGKGFMQISESVFGVRDETVSSNSFAGVKIFFFRAILVEINGKKKILIYSENRHNLLIGGSRYNIDEVVGCIRRFASTIPEVDLKEFLN